MSEGIDFKDEQARLVIIVGVPLPNIFDPYVVIKREILEKREPKWLDKVSIRAVNQAIGRVIRHAKDYGSIVLIERRYQMSNYNCLISKWLSNRMSQVQNTEEVCKKIDAMTQENRKLEQEEFRKLEEKRYNEHQMMIQEQR